MQYKGYGEIMLGFQPIHGLQILYSGPCNAQSIPLNNALFQDWLLDYHSDPNTECIQFLIFRPVLHKDPHCG